MGDYNYNNLNYEESLKSISDFKKYDLKESIINSKHGFSDESLIRVLIEINNVPVHHISRNIDIYNDWIDRSWWKIDNEKLNSGDYIESNLLRPYGQHISQIKPIVDFLNNEL